VTVILQDVKARSPAINKDDTLGLLGYYSVGAGPTILPKWATGHKRQPNGIL